MTRRIKRLYYVMEHDGKQAEWVVVAFLANEPRMIDVIRSGKDPHTMTAAFMWGIEPDVIVAENKALGKITSAEALAEGRKKLAAQYPVLARPDLPANSTLRQGGKKDNHAGNYGEGPHRYAEINGVTLREAEMRLYRYSHTVYPGIQDYWADVQWQLKRNHFLVNPLGRKLPIMGPTHCAACEGRGSRHHSMAHDTYKQGYAAAPQSVVHDVIMWAQPSILTLKPDILLLSDNHDSNTTQHWIDPREGREACAAKILREAKQIAKMMHVPMKAKGGEFAIEIETKAGCNWAEAGSSNPWGMIDLERSEEGALRVADHLLAYTETL